MAIIIKDGTGTGNTAKVNDEGRLFTNSITLDDDTAKAQTGDAYIGITNIVTVTSDNESAILYVKNLESRDIVLELIGIQTGVATGASATLGITKLIRNPTGGTIVSEAVAMTVSNRNYGSSNTLNADTFKGGEGKTLTGGTESVIAISSYPGGGSFTTTLVIPKGSSAGIKMTPPTGTTSADISLSFNVHLNGFSD